MISLPRTVKVWAYPAPCDLRKGYNGLYALVESEMSRNPLSGELFLFVNRRRNSCKVLLWDGTGLCIFMKRLEQGRFAKLWCDGHSSALSLSPSELSLFLEGCVHIGQIELSPPEVTF